MSPPNIEPIREPPHEPPHEPQSEVVFASAGSGKTYELTSRFLALFAQGEDPKTLLASTFTRTAAGEILQRIVERLADAATSQPHREELARATAVPLTAVDCSALLDRLLANLHRLNVATIDALFARLAAAFSLELGVAPAWRIAETEIDLELREKALDAALADNDPADTARVIEMLLAGEARSIRSQILKLLADATDEIRDIGPSDAPWQSLRPTIAPLSESQLADAIETLKQMPLPLTKAGKPSASWQSAHQTMLAHARTANWEEIAKSKLAGVALHDLETYSRVPAGTAQRDALRAIATHAAAEELWRHYHRSTARRDLARRFDVYYQRIKVAEGLLRFDDLPRMLDEAHVLGDLEELYFRLDARTRHVLLDEFQDTSTSQFRLLEPILSEILSQHDGRSVFVVGDAKQSLFGWRNAEPELLAHLPDRWPILAQRTLARSWRSSQTVLDAVNQVFQNLDTNAALAEEPAARNWRERFEPHVAAKDLAGSVRLLESRPAEDEDRLQASLNLAAERVAAIHRDHPGASIAVIVRRNKTIRTMVSLLRNHRLDASEEGGSPLTDSAPVVAALSLIHLADHPADTASLYHVATSPLAHALNLADHTDLRRAAQVASDTRTHINTVGLAHTLARLADSIAGQMDAREAERFERLIDLAQEFDAQGWTRLDRFCDMVKHRRIESPTPAAIRVMTIHKAKGLEFDAVVLPELDEKIEPRPTGILTQRDAPLGEVQRATVHPPEHLRKLDPRLEEVFQSSRTRHLEEALSLLYVAMTRARCALELIVQQDPRTAELSHARILRAAVPSNPQPDSNTLYETGDDTWQPQAPASQAPEPNRIPLALRERPTPLASRLARQSPSTPAGPVRVRDRLILAESAAQTRGKLIHRWCEAITWLDQHAPTEQELLAIAHEDGFDDALAHASLNDFRRALQSPPIGKLFSNAPPGAELWRERPFAIRHRTANTDHLLTGRFDRVVIERAQEKPIAAHAIDFKTDHVQAHERDALIERYAPQMHAYRSAAAALLHIPEPCIRCSLALLATSEVIELPHAPEERHP